MLHLRYSRTSTEKRANCKAPFMIEAAWEELHPNASESFEKSFAADQSERQVEMRSMLFGDNCH